MLNLCSKDNLGALLDQVDIISKNNNNILLSTPSFLLERLSLLENNLELNYIQS